MMTKPADTDQLIVGPTRFSFRDISTVVDHFYQQVAVDPVLKVPFNTVEDWPHHIERLTQFWWFRFGGDLYMEASYNPVLKHFEAGFNQEFLCHWLELFKKTLSMHLQPEQAQVWSNVVDRMGQALLAKDQMYRAQINGF